MEPARPLAPPFPAYPQVAAVPLFFFSSYVLLWYLQIGYRVPFLGEIRFELLFALGLAVFAILRGFSLGSPLTGHLVVLLVCMAVQVPFSYAFERSFSVFVDGVLKFFWMALFIVAFVRGPRELKWFLGAFLLACFKMGQEGFLGQVSGSLVWQNQGVMRLHGSTPMYEHPNSFSGMALGTLPFVFYLFPLCNRWLKALLLLQALFAATIVLFSGSRTAYLGVIGFVTVVLCKSNRKFRAVGAALLVAAIALPLVPQEYVERFQTIFTQDDKEGQSTELRIEILRDSWQIFASHPLGVGVGAFPAVRTRMFGRTQDTHNLYLEVATNLGVQGFVVFTLFIIAQWRLLSKLASTLQEQIATIESTGPPEQLELVRLRLKHLFDLRLMKQTARAIQGFLAVRLTVGMFGMDLYEIYWWFAMGLTIALYRMEQVARQRSDVFMGPRPPAAARTFNQLVAGQYQIRKSMATGL